MQAALPANEAARLRALESYEILDTSPEQGFDDLALLASQICQTPIALMSLVDGGRQWFKSRVGLDVSQTPRELSFCAHALLEPDHLFVVPDTRDDPRFCDNGLVRSEPLIRFYAGAPLVTADGEALGTLCVVDRRPRDLTPDQEEALRALARQAMMQLELRRSLLRLADELALRAQTEAQLRESESRFEAFMDAAPIVAFLKDSDGRFAYVNQPLLKRFGLTRDQVIGHTDFDLWPEVAAGMRETDAQVVAGEGVVEVLEEVPTSSGETRFWQSFKFPLQRGGGRGRFLAGVALDVTDKKLYEQQLERTQTELQRALERVAAESRTDSLTGLNNRRAFTPRFEDEFDRAARYDFPLSVLMLDVDCFKTFNDAFGHGSGDEVLQTIARLMLEKARASDFVARLGGEEFVVILPNTGSEGAFILAERIRRSMEEAPWRLRPITISIGIATHEPNIPGADALLDRADEALYRAKSAGRNRVVHWNQG